MSVYCKSCSAANPRKARFCGICGTTLAHASVACASSTRRDFALAAVAGALLLSVVVAAAAVRHARRENAYIAHQPMVEREFTICAAKAGALYDLLKPRHVAVVVGRSTGGLSVRGTEAEVQALAGLVEILNRVESTTRQLQDNRMDQLRGTWTTRRTYKLDRGKSKAVHRLLAFDNVPVLVSRSGSKVTIEASPDDRDTIDLVVRILRGCRF